MSFLPLDSIVCCDALEGMKSLPSGSVDFWITSPPYNAGKSYEEKLSEEEYFAFIDPIVAEAKRVLKPDGRFCINVCFNINRKTDSGEKVVLFPFFSWVDSLRKNGLQILENIVWNQLSSECDTAWGSWMSASAPHIRHMTEYVLLGVSHVTENVIVGFNENWKKAVRGKSDISAKEFSKWTLDRWDITAEQSRKIKAVHPAPFPSELAERCIKLFTFVGDVVLDCFGGSGTSAVEAKRWGRRYVLFDSSQKYCGFARRRVANVPLKLEPFLNVESPLFQVSNSQSKMEKTRNERKNN